MRIYIRTCLILLSVFAGNLGFAQSSLDNMIKKLKQANYGKIFNLPDSIPNYQKQAIPKLIELLKDTSYVKLINTADLIYPGTKEFWGHGSIVNYDIDWISVRAAWILENITFQDFGYLNRPITEDSLMKIHMQDYSNYLKKGYHDIDLKNKTPRQQLIIYRLMLADSVSKWWSKNQHTWTRFQALKEALASNNINRQRSALHYLRFETTKCDELTHDSYWSVLRPLIKKIRHSKSEEKEQADYLLKEDSDIYLKK